MSEKGTIGPFKNLYNKNSLQDLSKAIKGVYSPFDTEAFLAISGKFKKLEMKGRVNLISETLFELLPSDYKKSLEVLLKSVKRGNLRGFILWPYTYYIKTYGKEYFKESLEALKLITPYFTAEFAIRPYITKNPKEALLFLQDCAKKGNVDERRWASEGSRPRLPWGERLYIFIEKPKLTLPILNLLKFDSELYVRKSVANHLNDISKDHPRLVINTLNSWKKLAKKNEDKEKIQWIIRHSLRTLIKAGDGKALELIGVKKNAPVSVRKLRMSKKSVKEGESFLFDFEVRSLSRNKEVFVIDYAIHFLKSNGKRAPKVFKLKTVTLAPGEKVLISKKHSMKKITTRKYYPGKHGLAVQVNGEKKSLKYWDFKI